MMKSIKNANSRKKISLGEDDYDIGSIIMISSNSRPIEYLVEGDKNKRINGIAPIDEATIEDLSFCSWEAERAFQLISNSQAGIILCKNSLKGVIHPRQELQQQLVFVDNPRLLFVQFVNRVLQRRNEQEQPQKDLLQLEKQQVSTNNDDGSKTNKGESYYAASTAVISPDAKIGKSCRIGNFVVIGRNCSIGDYTVIHDKVTLGQNCSIGTNCLIQSGVTIGEDGFAYERHASSGQLERFPHFGGVVIGNNVEISANCSIARGSLTDTVIGDGTKIDALVHIAHNVRIGKNCQLTAGTVIGGSTQLGDSCWTGLNCTIKNKVNVGNNVIIGAGACAIKDIEDGDVVAGVPAKSIKSKISTSEVFQMAGQKASERINGD